LNGLRERVQRLEAEVAELRAQINLSTSTSSSDQPDTEAILYRRLTDAGKWVSGDGRISESDFAWLIGQTRDAVRNRRRYGDTPPWFKLGSHGSKVSYRVRDIALWIDGLRGED
jgi:hypothetical protein